MILNNTPHEALQAGKNDNGITKDLSDLFNGLFPAWPTILATILAVTVLLIVLTKYVWKPIKKSVNDRHNFIQSNIDIANEQKMSAIIDRKKAMEELDTARIEAMQIVTSARLSAEEAHNQIMEQAHAQSKSVLLEAEQEIEREKTKLKAQAHAEIITVAFAAAEKILEKNVDSKTNRKLVEEYINSHYEK